jgi:hypothetical protein
MNDRHCLHRRSYCYRCTFCQSPSSRRNYATFERILGCAEHDVSQDRTPCSARGPRNKREREPATAAHQTGFAHRHPPIMLGGRERGEMAAATVYTSIPRVQVTRLLLRTILYLLACVCVCEGSRPGLLPCDLFVSSLATGRRHMADHSRSCGRLMEVTWRLIIL